VKKGRSRKKKKKNVHDRLMVLVFSTPERGHQRRAKQKKKKKKKQIANCWPPAERVQRGGEDAPDQSKPRKTGGGKPELTQYRKVGENSGSRPEGGLSISTWKQKKRNQQEPD